MAVRTRLTDVISERASRVYHCVLTQRDGTPVPKVAVTSIAATLRDFGTNAVINGRLDQDVKDAHGGTLGDTDGVFELILTPDDNAIMDPRTRKDLLEFHILTLDIVYTTGRETHEAELLVQNLGAVS